jgi:hypothetical protein
MKTYSVLFAEDVPHYGVAEIKAQSPEAAIEAAKVHDRDDLSAWDAEWGSAVCARIVEITDDETGAVVARDIPLDECFLREGGERGRLLCDAAPDLLAALRRLVSATAPGFEDRDEAEEEAAWTEANAAIAKATGRTGGAL